MKKLSIVAFLILTACATPKTILKNEDGDTVSCGGSSTGSVIGGMIGYSIQKDTDDKCVKSYMSQGYTPTKIGDIQVNKDANDK